MSNKVNVVVIDGDSWYTAGEAAAVLTRNSGRVVRPNYVTKLGSMEVVTTRKVHARLTLYSKQDIDNYVVESRGTKSGAAKKEKAARKHPKKSVVE